MTMTYDQVAELLAFCAVFDQRKGDDLDVKAWQLIANDHRWTPAAAMRIAREHYGSGSDRPRIDPATITDRIRKLRNQAAESFEAPVISGVQGASYPEWYRSQLAAHVDAQLERWASTGQEPDRALPFTKPGPGALAELVASAPDHIRAGLAAAAQRMTRRNPR